MKKADDDEIQKILEQDLAANGSGADTDDDFKAYKTLFEALKKEPDSGLPYNFAANMSRELRRRRDDSKDIKLYLWLGLIIFIVFAGVCVYTMQAYSTHIQFIASTIKPYLWIFIFSVACLLIIQYLDQKLIKSPDLGDRFDEK
jgi:hypothetical protein